VTTIEQQMDAVKSAASWTKQPTEQERSILMDAYFTLKGLIKEKKKKVDECYKPFVEAWCAAYPELGFDAISGRKIKAIITKTKKYLTASEKEPTLELALGMFKYVLAYNARTNHWCHGKDISTFEAKYLSIVYEIKNGKTNATSKKQSPRDFVNSFR
jgi:hypothetical protein